MRYRIVVWSGVRSQQLATADDLELAKRLAKYILDISPGWDGVKVYDWDEMMKAVLSLYNLEVMS